MPVRNLKICAKDVARACLLASSALGYDNKAGILEFCLSTSRPAGHWMALNIKSCKTDRRDSYMS